MTLNASVSYKYLLLLSFSIASAAQASENVDTRIHDVISPNQAGESYRIMSTTDGRVYEVDSRQRGLQEQVLTASRTHLPLHLSIEGDRILSVRPFTSVEVRSYQDRIDTSAPSNPASESLQESLGETDGLGELMPAPGGLGYQVTRLSSMAEADSLFSSLRQLSHKSQCYQRAHYWARQMWLSRSVNSMKVFLFFTQRFIREHKYHWWFHVAPFVYVGNEEVVLDPEFIRSTKLMDDWMDFFMMDRHFVKNPLSTRPGCPSIASYSEYDNNQQSQLCYVLKLPMYYYQPTDAEKLADSGTRIEGWRTWDVDHSKKAESSGWLW